jgi:DNA polymerase-3 subunit alpha
VTVADPLENVRAWWDEDAELDPETYEPADEPTPNLPEPTPTAPSQDFVHLHVHSEFSLLDGLSPVKHIVDAAKRNGMRSVALTDHGNMYGAIDFYSYAKSAGVKPILGVETYVSPRGMADKLGTQDRNYFHLVLLAKNLDGYHNLIKLVSRASLEGYYYKPRIDRALLAEHAKGLIALSACYSGEPSRAILESDFSRARDAAGWYREVFGEDYFLELQDHGNSDDQTVNAGLLELHKQLGIPLVATNDSHYALPEQANAQDVLLCVQTNSTDQDPKRMRMQPLGAFCLKSPAEMWQLFGHVPDALRNTVAIAERCDLKLEFGRLSFPSLDHLIPTGQSPQEFLTRTCQDGLLWRYGQAVTREHRERLRYELDVVQKTDFAAYILFVWDFVDWARKRGIPCGPRGSAAGSIILYCLGISDLDPVHYGLTFERFLNPERIQMPDIDMDFADDRRDEVIQYVIDRYGSERVAQIITFGRLLARAAIRDVGRALDYPLNEVDRVAKLIPPVPIGLKIADALEQSIELKTLYEGQPHIKKLIDTARSVEGVARHAGTHAAGIVVADQPLTNYVPLQRATRGDSAMTQYDMKVLDKIGLIKMDFLGLANLTMLAKALDNIKLSHDIDIDLGKLPLDDAKTYAMLSRGETRTVFQLEGSGMTRSVVELQPSTLDHLAALVALYRPGPMAHIPSYILRRDGREAPTPPDPSLEDVLKDSYGIIVYQDQVLQVVRKLAGYSLGQADVLRRAMGKKEKEVMALEGPKFISAAVQNGFAATTAERVWELLQPFANYAFNKCLVANSTLVDAQTGERTTVGSLYSHPRPFAIHALGPDGKLRARRVTDVLANGRKPVFELRTAQGRRITATANHPFRTLNGWTNLEDLRPGDRVAAPRQLKVESTASWPKHELVVLAGLLSEGNTCHPSTLYFYNNDAELVEDFVGSASMFSDTVAQVSARENGRWVVRLNTGRDTRFSAGQRPWNARSAVIDEAAPATRSGVYQWAERLGIVNRKAPEKRIPDAVFRLRDEDIEVFVGRLWSGDGFIANAANFAPFYATSSIELARDVQLLLLRLGVVSGVHHKTFKYRGGTRPGWTVYVVGASSIESFVRRIAPYTVGRKVAIAQLQEHLASTAPDLTSVDTLPEPIRAWVDRERCAAGITCKQLAEKSGVAMRQFAAPDARGKYGFRRTTVQRLAAFFGSDRLMSAATSDVFWDRVVSIEPRGEEPTYDLTVQVDHNFVADGLVVHNSHAFCYALVAYQTAYLKANYPVEWFAAVLSTIAADTDKVVGVVGECRRVGVPVLPPDVNASTLAFRVESGGIRFGLAAVKNVGEGAVEQIVREREANGGYTSLEEFCRRQDLHTINKRVVESLIKCGAMDGLGLREALLDSKRLDSAIAAAQIDQKAASTGQVSLFDVFGGAETSAPKPVPVEVDAAAAGSASARERALWEKEVLGFQFGDHPFLEASAWLGPQLSHDTSQLTAELAGEKVKIAGLVTSVRRILTKTKSQMAVLVLEDLHGTIEAVVFPRIYERSLDVIREDAILIVEGKVDSRSDRVQLVVDRVEAWVAPPTPSAQGSGVRGQGSVKGANGIPGHSTEKYPATSGSNANGSPAAERNAKETRDADGNGSPSDRNATVAPGADGNGSPAAERNAIGASGADGSSSLVTVSNANAAQASNANGAPGADGNGSQAAEANGNGAHEKRVLRVVVPRGDDDNACVRVLEQLHLLVERSPGADEIHLVLHDRAGARIELSGADILVQHSPDLESQVRTLVGAENLQVVSG